MKKDELELQKKLKQNLSKDFDENFWKRYDNEIQKEESSFGLWMPATGFAAACLVLFVVLTTNNTLVISEKDMLALSNEVEMYENIDMFSDMSEDMMHLNDEEWNELLNTI